MSSILTMISSRRKFIKRALWASVGLLLLDVFWFEKYVVQWNEYDLKEDGDTIKIIQLSDLHLKSVGYHHRQIAEKINAIKPDLVLLTGDVIDDHNNLPLVKKFLELLDKDLVKIAITGNWEYWGKVDLVELKTVYTAYQCEFLINEFKQYKIKGRTLTVIGIDDLVGGNADYELATQFMPEADVYVTLCHCPEYTDVIKKAQTGIKHNLILSGHTHGGQISFLGYAPFKPPGSGPYLKGWYKTGPVSLYVSKGIGTSVLPIRLGSRAEVAIFNI